MSHVAGHSAEEHVAGRAPVAYAHDVDTLRHSAAHVMAKAVERLYPGTRIAIGPTIEHGFYYDLDVPGGISVEDLPKIEAEMERIIAANEPFERVEWPREEAIRFYRERGNPYKVEVLEAIADETVSLYKTGPDWIDLCRGPHVPAAGEIKAFKLLNVAGAYWRGDERRPMLTRIYGTAWPSREELEQYLWRLEEARKRDHRKLGQELDLYSFNEEVGAGVVLWHPKGATLRRVIEEYWKQRHDAAGYQYVYTPHVGNVNLWRRSGHLDFYADKMYPRMEVDELAYLLKPMNCPFHLQIYRSHLRSYRDLPIRFCELGTVYRYERPGELHGLLRVRGITQDDAHIFCRLDQLQAEIAGVLDLGLSILRDFGFEEFRLDLSLRDPANPGKYLGSDEVWDRAEAALRAALEEKGLAYQVAVGEAAFYGPKIDIHLADALGRTWQMSTIQVDFNFPEKFDLTYIGEDGKEHRVVMVHRALLGSIERFVGVLVEHYAGAFPLWLAPVQAVVLPIADRHLDYARQVAERLRAAGFRAQVDDRRERVQKKIREAELQKVPYMLVVGDREAQSGSVAVRERSHGDLGPQPLEQLLATLQERQAART